MGPFAHSLFSAIMADDVAPRVARQPAARRPSPTVGTDLVTGLSLNPLFQAETDSGASMKGLEAAQSRSLLDSIGIGLDAAALATIPFPLIGDATGLVADAFATVREPSLLNFGLMGLGALPILPAAGPAKRATKRAADLGFGDLTTRSEDLFHGTAADFRQVDPDRAGEAAGFGHLDRFLPEKPALWLTDDPALASYYAELAAKGRGGVGANVMPLRVRSERPVRLDLEGANLKPREFYGAILDRIDRAVGAKRFGDKLPDTVVLENVPTPLGGPPRNVKVVVSFDPAKIRSIFAKFDPKKASSSDLLAGLAAAGLLLPLGRLAQPEAPAVQP